MTSEDIIGRRVGNGWAPTDTLLALWRGSTASQALQPGMLIAGPDRKPDPLLLGLWRRAFAGVAPLGCTQEIVTSRGTPTEWMLSRFRLVA